MSFEPKEPTELAHGELRMTVQDQAILTTGGRPWKLRVATLDGAAPQLSRSDSAAWGREGSRDAPVPITAHRRLSDAFFAAVYRCADRPALVTSSQTFRYAELGHQSLCVADHLRTDRQYCPGDRVAVMLDNGPEFIAAYYGVLAAGGVVVPLPANIEWSRFERIARICRVKKVLCSRRTITRRTEIPTRECESIDLDASRSVTLPRAEPLMIDGQSLAMIMFTSGSSGDPKGVMLSDGNLLANTESILGYLPITQEDRALALLPFYHAFGHSIMQTHLLAGATMVVDGNMAFPNTVIDALEHHRATSFSAVPEGYYALLSMSDICDRELPHLRYMSVAGGALKPDCVAEVAGCIAPAEFYVMYGQTEAAARLAYLPAHLARTHPDSMGVAIPGVELRVLDGDGHEAVPNETGELCARGANVMLGYWNDPQGTGRVIRDGWLRTGDLVSRDEQGLFFVKARKNDLVKVQGFRIHPREVEEVISEHFPAVRIIVIPYQHQDTTRLALYGITGIVNPHIEDELRRVCMRELPRHKIPSLVEVLTQPPLNASMKLDRAALRRRAEHRASHPPQLDVNSSPMQKKSA